MKIIDTKSYLDTLCELTDEGKTVSVLVSGGSMAPFLCANRDYVFLEKAENPLKKGDIVLFTRENGDYILHRIKKITSQGYYLTGDRQTALEGPVNSNQIHCVATSAKRKEQLITPKNAVWKFYSKVWINIIFLRPLIFKIAGFFRKKRKKQKQ